MVFIKKKDLFLLEEIVKRNFYSKYKDSVLGIFWTILSPLLMMILFTVVFSTIFAKSVENYYVYFICGWSVFQWFSSSVSISMNALKGNKSILQRTPAPKYIFILGGIISEFLNFIIMIILLLGIMLVTQASFHFPTMLFSVFPVFCLCIMVTGLGLIVSIACVYYTDIRHLWTVVSMMLMYASAVFYPMDIVPEPYRGFLELNPLYWVIDQFRTIVYSGMIPQMINMINLLLLSLIILVMGVIVFKKYEKKIALKF